jgi:biotin carboxylase
MKKIVIIGANNFQLPLIIKAREMGYETHVFAWETGAVARDHCDHFYPVSIIEKEKILQMSKDISPDAVVSVGSDLASITVNFVASNLGLTSNSIRCTELTTDKFLMRRRLSANGIPCPGFIKATNSSDLTGIERLNYPLIVKPVDRSGSRGVTKVEDVKYLENAIERGITESFHKEVVIEEFITGKEFSLEMISWKGEHHFLQMTEKQTTGAPYFVEEGQHQPANIPEELRDKAIHIVIKALSALEVEFGASHSEVLITSNGEIYIVETGARMGGDYIGSHLVELSTGYDFLKATIEVATGKFTLPKLLNSHYSGIYYIIPPPGRLVSILDETKKFKEIVKTEIYYKPGDIVPVVKESNDRAAAFIYRSEIGRLPFDKSILQVVTE